MVRLNTNSEVAHAFYYSGGTTDYTFNTNCSFNLNLNEKYLGNTVTACFYSYYTRIGLLVNATTTNQTYLLISDSNMTSTTSQHLNYLRRACPLSVKNFYYLPFEYGSHYHSLKNIHDYLKEQLEKEHNKPEDVYTKQADREYLTTLINQIRFTTDILNFTYNREQVAILEKRKINLLNSDFIKKLKAKQRKAALEKAKKEKQELEALKNKYNYYDLILAGYTDYTCNAASVLTPPKIRKILDPNNKLSFIWFNGDKVCTSQGIRVNKNKVVTLLKLWQHGKLKHGMKIECYTVREVMKDYVQVGCHKIPTENLKALLDVIKKDERAVA